MSSQPTVVAQPVVVHVLCGWCGDMLWEAHWLVVQHNNTKKYCTTVYKTQDTVAYTTHSGSYSMNAKRKYITHWYTIFTAVHNRYMTQKNFRLPECQVASTMISVLIMSSTLPSQC